MNQTINKICKDPLFQLNLAIMLAQSLPDIENFHIYPLFYKSGLDIYSVGPLLALPPATRLAVPKRMACQDGARPDLILETKKTKKLCILECKTSSFSPNSVKQSSQARTLLLIAGPVLYEVLGLKKGGCEGILCYLTSSNQIDEMETTLTDLAQEMKKATLKTGEYGCFGLKPERSAIFLEFSREIKNFLNLIKDSPVQILFLNGDTDPRTLYFIPYDPNIQQTNEEQKLCRRILFERILSYIVSKIGGATVPSSIIFTTTEILNSATFGIYEVWEDNEAKKHIRGLVKEFLMDLCDSINGQRKKHITYERQKGWIFDFKDREIQQEILRQLCKFKPETLDLSKSIDPTLFDI